MGPIETLMMVLAVAWIACGAGCAILAINKDRNPVAWGLVGLLLGLIGVAIIATMPRAQAAAPSLPVEGWYAHPDDEDDLRWWDGARWTGATRPAEEAPAPPLPSA